MFIIILFILLFKNLLSKLLYNKINKIIINILNIKQSIYIN